MLKGAAGRELARAEEVFDKIRVKKIKKAQEFHEFALNYFKDGQHFFKKGKYLEAFEAAVIAWAYIDAGLKLEFFKVPKELKDWFTA